MLEKVKSLFGAQDMTVGSPMKVIAKFTIPLLIGNLAQQLYSTVDSVVVGKYCTIERNGYTGVDALSAVGASGPIINLLIVLFIAIATGAGILVAQYFGAKDKERLSSCVGTSITLVFIAGLFFTIVGLVLSRPLLTLINTPQKYIDLAASYLQISFIGLIGMAFYNIISGILRGLGDSFYPLVYLLVSSALNIVLDILFVASLGWGVHGVAWATIISQGVSAVLCIIRLTRMKNILSMNTKELVPNKEMTLRTLKLGLPAGITQGVFSLAMVMVQNLTNKMGDFVPAINVAIMRVDGFAVLPAFTFGLAISTYIGQNIGARKQERLKPGERSALVLALGISSMIVSALFIFGKCFIGFFINKDTTDAHIYQSVVALGGRGLRILAVGYIALGIQQIYAGILRAAGDTMSSMIISIITTVVVRVPLAYTIAFFTRSEQWQNGHPDALFLSLVTSWTLNATLTFLRYKQGKWKKIDLIGKKGEC
ncbi:MAG: MATE family efflux transporter [Treponemataceae bacterium]|nr:MATE family efflux transporter [Treponemataceae bacterium]